jgi:hypothetical protein
MKIFHVVFLKNGESEPCTKTYWGVDIGNALAKWKRDYPDAKLVNEWSEASAGGHHLGYVTYEPVSTTEPEPLSEVKAEEIVFPFFDNCLGKRPILTVE